MLRLPPGGDSGKNLPIDWFDPKYFNALPVSIRAQYNPKNIAMPAKDDCNNLSWAELKAAVLDREKFIKTHGRKVKGLFNYPTEEEIKNAQMESGDESDESDEDRYWPEEEAENEDQDMHADI